MRKFVLLFLTLFAISSASFACKKPVTDPETLDYLAKSIVEHLKKLDSQGKLELVELQSAIHQTTAGSKFVILAKLKENDLPLNCTIAMWEQPWSTDYLKLNVECWNEKRTYSYPREDAQQHGQQDCNRASSFSPMSDEALREFTPKLSNLFVKLKDFYDSEFNYALKRVVSGKDQVWAGMHSILRIEVTRNNHPDQIRVCEGILFENVQLDMIQFYLKCEGKEYSYKNYD